MSKRFRTVAAILVLLATAIVFIRFFYQHPAYLRQVAHINPWLLLLIIFLYGLSILILLFIYDATIRLCSQRLPLKQLFFLTSYSSIANFFGPFQSGPGVRALYLKAKYGLRLRDYTLATFIYYGLYAFVSVFFLLAGAGLWRQAILALIAVTTLGWLGIRTFARRNKDSHVSQFRIQKVVIIMLGIWTLLQVLLSALIFFIELRAISPHVGWGQAMSYTGAANFSLFVSFTPGAIGFRESFLLFSQHLHHISTATIFAANLIDRAAYVITLGILFVVIASLHAGRRLELSKLK